MELDSYEPVRFASGIKTAAFVVILGTIAVLADHAFFIEPHQQAPVASAPAIVAPATVGDGFKFADSLRPTQADVQTPPASF